MTSEEVKTIRKGLKFTQKQLAKLLGVHPMTIAKWERGALSPSAYRLDLLGSFKQAIEKVPDIGIAARLLLLNADVSFVLFFILQAAFEKKHAGGALSVPLCLKEEASDE